MADKKIIAYHGGEFGEKYFWFSSNPHVAASYGSVHFRKNGIKTPILDDYQEYEITLRNPYIVDAKEHYYIDIPTPKNLREYWHSETIDTDGIVDIAYNLGYGSVWIKNVSEGHNGSIADDYILFNKNDFRLIRDNKREKEKLIKDISDLIMQKGIKLLAYDEPTYIMHFEKPVVYGTGHSGVEYKIEDIQVDNKGNSSLLNDIDDADSLRVILNAVKKANGKYGIEKYGRLAENREKFYTYNRGANMNEEATTFLKDREERNKNGSRVKNPKRVYAAKKAHKTHGLAYRKGYEKMSCSEIADFLDREMAEAKIVSDNKVNMFSEISFDNLTGAFQIQVEENLIDFNIILAAKDEGRGLYRLENDTSDKMQTSLIYNTIVNDLKTLADSIDRDFEAILKKNGLVKKVD